MTTGMIYSFNILLSFLALSSLLFLLSRLQSHEWYFSRKITPDLIIFRYFLTAPWSRYYANRVRKIFNNFYAEISHARGYARKIGENKKGRQHDADISRENKLLVLQVVSGEFCTLLNEIQRNTLRNSGHTRKTSQQSRVIENFVFFARWKYCVEILTQNLLRIRWRAPWKFLRVFYSMNFV